MRRFDFFAKSALVALFAFAAACGGDQPGAEQDAGDAPVVVPAEGAPAAGDNPAIEGNVIEVRMVTTQGGASGVFEPAEINASQGDVIRFVQVDGVAAHNVQFPAQRNPAGAQLPPPSRYTTQPGEIIEIPVTMEPGSYAFECLPHAATGMVGTLNVQ
jgi:plastocyanin